MKASKAVKEQLTLYQQWYPNTYQLKAYPLEGRKALTVKNRQEIYQRLMKPQRLLIEKHKKYIEDIKRVKPYMESLFFVMFFF